MQQALDLNTGLYVPISDAQAASLQAQVDAAISDADAGDLAVGFYSGEAECYLGFDPNTHDPVDFPEDDESGIGILPLLMALPALIPVAKKLAPGVADIAHRMTERRLRKNSRKGGRKGAKARAKLKQFLVRKKARLARRKAAKQAELQKKATAPSSPSHGIPAAGTPMSALSSAAGKPDWGNLASKGLSMFSRNHDGGAVSGGTLFPRVWSDSVVGADYVHPQLDADEDGNFLGDDNCYADDVVGMAEFDEAMADIEEEQAELGEVGRGGRAKRIRRRQSRMSKRLARAQRKGKGRRARRLSKRMSKSEKLLDKVMKRAQKRARRRGGPSVTDVSRVRPGAKPSSVEAIAQSFSPSDPQEGRLVTIPLEISSLNYTAGALALSTTVVASATKTFQSDGISYAELRLIGLVVEMVTQGVGAALAGFEVTAIAGNGNMPAIYGSQPTLVDTEGYATGTKNVANATGFARLVIIGLRDKAEINKTQKINSTIRVFAATAAATGALNYLLTCQAILNTISDPNAAASK